MRVPFDVRAKAGSDRSPVYMYMSSTMWSDGYGVLNFREIEREAGTLDQFPYKHTQ